MKKELNRLKKAVQMDLEIIDPLKAKQWLDNHANPKNRQGRKESTSAKTYAMAMTNGEWKVNGETIVFDSKGMLIDGHTRLAAVIQSGKSIISVIIRGVDPDAVFTMDQGKSRTQADSMYMKDTTVKYPKTTQSVLQGVLNYRATGIIRLRNSGLSTKYTVGAAEAERNANKQALDWAIQLGVDFRNKCDYFTMAYTSLVAYILLVEKGHPAQLIEDFFGQLSGEIQVTSKAVQVLKDKFKTRHNNLTKIGPKAERFYLTKTWNLYVNHKYVKKLNCGIKELNSKVDFV